MPGGGRFGDPAERAVAHVGEDVCGGLVDAGEAERIYGVRVDVAARRGARVTAG